MYGKVDPAELPLTEDSPLRPASPYAASRSPPTTSGCRPGSAAGLPVLRVRAFNHLGPGQTDKFVAPALASRIARDELDGGDVLTVGNLSARRDFTDVRDVVRAYRLLMERGEPGEVYNVCSGVDLAVQELADELLALAKRADALRDRPRAAAPGRHPGAAGRPRRLTAATGWEPEIPIGQTLADLLEDWRAASAPRPESRPAAASPSS